MTHKLLWSPPSDIVPDWALDHPRVFYTKENIALARRGRSRDAPDWMKQISTNLIEQADASRWMGMADDEIRKLVPQPYAYYMYGVTEPVGPDGTRIHPIGWEAPGLVKSEGGHIYPDEEHPDDGTGWDDGRGNRYYFVARWNGFVIDEMTRALEPLVYAYVVSGDVRYAHKAGVILDALATVYPTAVEGPLDYPGSKPGKEGGRLERPFYQVARTLIWYVNAVDLIWDSGVLDVPSATNPGVNVKENVVYNLLLNGADYCDRESQLPGYVDQLHNGTADYNLGMLAVGSLLGIQRYVDWAIEGPTSIRYMMMNNVDRDGNYFETSASYSRWTQALYMKMAELLYHVRTPKWPNGFNLYDDPRFVRFYVGIREKNTIAGRIPAYGDSKTDEKTDASASIDPQEAEWLLHFYIRTENDEKRKEYLKALSPSIHSTWSLFNLPMDVSSPTRKPTRKKSGLLGGKGLAFLRSGSGDKSRGAVMRYGVTLNHGQLDELGVQIYDEGRELSFDPGYDMAHYRGGWQFQTISHLAVAVNGVSQLSAASSGGSVNLFAAAPGLSVVDASDESAYAKEGVSQYRRLVAWIDWSEHCSYMVDVFRVDGGRMRDYSFHAKGTHFEVEGLQLFGPEPGSVASRQYDWGRRILGDGKVKDFTGEPFSFIPPGEGYGFLGAPRRGKPEGLWSASWTDPGRLKLTMLPADNREIIVADGPSKMGVKYLLARDTGDSPSRFVSVVETGNTGHAAQIAPLQIGDKGESPEKDQTPSEVVAVSVTSEASGNGTTRDYILSTLDSKVFSARDTLYDDSVTFTDAEFAFLRKDPDGEIVDAHMVKGTVLRHDWFKLMVPQPALVGTVVSVDEMNGRLQVVGPWCSPVILNGVYGFVDNDAYSHNSPYRIRQAELDGEMMTIDLDPNDIVLAGGKLSDEPTDGILPNQVNLPYSRNVLRHGPNHYFNGKRVRNHKGASALIRSVQDDYAGLEVDDTDGFSRGDDIQILDVKVGDRFVIPIPVHMKEQGPGEYEIHSPVTVLVAGSHGEEVEVRRANRWNPADRVQRGNEMLSRIDPHESGPMKIRFVKR